MKKQNKNYPKFESLQEELKYVRGVISRYCQEEARRTNYSIDTFARVFPLLEVAHPEELAKRAKELEQVYADELPHITV